MAGASPSNSPTKSGGRSGGTFVDSARIRVRAGHGGRGAASFRHEPYVPRGGPNGGDGGRGGSIILVADPQLSSLHDYVSRRTFSAADGKPGAKTRKEGGSADDVRLRVPVGTTVLDAESDQVLADLDTAGAEFVVARGGGGGRGNIHFKSSVNQAPDYAEPGRPGEEREVRLELRLIADAGLVGPPNAGKSSLLGAISRARPKVGAYPVTTLDPELGVTVTATGERFVVADIPGLIEGAAGGAGLGLRFLRHVERTRVLVYVVDGASADPFADLDAVRAEVRLFSADLGRRPSLVVVNKIDLPAAADLRRRTRRRGLHWVSAQSGEGVPELVAAIQQALVELPPPAPPEVAPVTLRPRRSRRGEPPWVRRREWGFEVGGPTVDRLLERVDFESDQSFDWFQVQLDRLGITSALEEAGVAPGDTVRMGGLEFEFQS